MNDDRIDELLARGARDYNEPGPIPRDAMWARIQAERAARPVAGAPSRLRPMWIWPSMAAAAAVILAAGVIIGRRLERTAAPVQSVAARAKPEPAPSDSQSARAAAGPAAATTDQDSLIQQLRAETRNTGRRARDLAAATHAPARDAQQAPEPSLAYHLVVLQHLAGSEAMITAFRTAARRGEMDAQLASWSRELLATTRLLEASSATQDPTMKRLLEDLDLVIAQIVQYATHGTNNSEELDLIEQSITTRGVIAKLRGTASARTSAAGT